MKYLRDLMRAPSIANCRRCGKPAQGYAFLDDGRYCHPDDPDLPDCYTLTVQEEALRRPSPASLAILSVLNDF